MVLLERGDEKIDVEACKPLRFAAENGKLAEMMAMLNARHEPG